MVGTVPRSNTAARSGSSNSRGCSRRSTAEALTEAASGSAARCSTQAAGGSERWSDLGACAAICQLILDSRSQLSAGQQRRRALPPALYAKEVASFLRFDSPLPNMIYAFGGSREGQGSLDTVEMFDTWHGEWVLCASMPTRREDSAASLLPDGRMIVVGGFGEKGMIATCDIYNPWLQCWEKNGAAPLARARCGHGCATLGNYVYVVGGLSLQPNAQQREASMECLKSCEVYDPEENRWSACASLQIAKGCGLRVVALGGDRYLAAIGGSDNSLQVQSTVELFDTVVGQWTALGPRLIRPRLGAAAAAIGDGRLLVVGGANSDALASAEVYQVPLPDEELSEGRVNCRAVEDLPEGRINCQAAVVDLPQPGGSYPLSTRRCAVIVGGARCDGYANPEGEVSSVLVFDIETGTWREDMIIPAMPTARSGVALCVGLGRVAQTAFGDLRGLGA